MCKFVVIGDSGLDTYLIGDSNRVSPEAPVVIVNVTKEEHRLGLAANVANNLTSFGIIPTLITSIGTDDIGTKFVALCKDNEINIPWFIENIRTTQKTRIIARHQQIVRVDCETRVPKNNVISHFNNLVNTITYCDAVIISDYNKGVLTNVKDIIQVGLQYNIPIYVDPKSNDFSKYRHVTLIKPNLSEFQAVYGQSDSDQELIDNMINARIDLDVKYLLVTLGARGIIAVDRQNNIYRSDEHQFEVVDVVGGGDVVIAAVAFCLQNGYTIKQAINIANDLAGISVRKMGTVVITIPDVQGINHLESIIKRKK